MTFDSDVLIWFIRGDRAASELINKTPQRSLSVVALMEVLQGARSKIEMRQIQSSLANLRFQVLPLNEQIGHIASGLIADHALAHGLRVEDALIAATALDSGEALATGNVRHFRPIRRLAITAFRHAN